MKLGHYIPDVIVPYFTAVFVLSNAVERKFVSPTDGFSAVGQCIHASVDINIASKILLEYRDFAHYEPGISKIELPKIN